jgi:chorismate--pyruvate lyase
VKIQAHFLYPRGCWLAKPVSSGVYRHWLIDGGSLTRRLQLCCSDFSVKPIKLHNAKPQLDEALILNLSPRQKALLREVYLCCAGKRVVFAHSVLPHKSLRGDWQGLGRLGNKSLGATLFTNPNVVRTALEFKKLSNHHALYHRAVANFDSRPQALWARRSVFNLNGAVILVTEVFLPQVLTL